MKSVFEWSSDKLHKEIDKPVLVFPVIRYIPFPLREPDGCMSPKIIDTAIDLLGFGDQCAGNYQNKQVYVDHFSALIKAGRHFSNLPPGVSGMILVSGDIVCPGERFFMRERDIGISVHGEPYEAFRVFDVRVSENLIRSPGTDVNILVVSVEQVCV